MITLLHGDNIEVSRIEFNKLKLLAKAKHIREIDGNAIDDNQLTQALESQSLFGGETVVFIENLFPKLGKKQKRIEAICTILTNSTADVIIWEQKEVGVSVTKNLGKAIVRVFKIPIIIFRFLDTFSLSLLQTTLKTEVPEIVFTMMVKRVRLLIQLADNVKPEGLADWQATRLTVHARTFTMDQLISMHKKLLNIEISIKTGTTPFTLTQLLEQFIIQL